MVPSVFLFCEMVLKGIPSVFIFGTKLRNSECFYKMVGNGIPSIFISAEWFGTKLLSSECSSLLQMVRNGIPIFFYFPRNGSGRNSVPRNRRNSVGINQNFRLFHIRGIIFFSEMATLQHTCAAHARNRKTSLFTWLRIILCKVPPRKAVMH